MINRIREVRQAKGLTLADVAARCDPPTTAQTVGRLETGMRNLSLGWMNRIAGALEVEPQSLVRSEAASPPRTVARLGMNGPEPLARPREAVSPLDFGSDAEILVVEVVHPCGQYREGDRIWLRQISADKLADHANRDALAQLSGGDLAFGRVFLRGRDAFGLLPLGLGQEQIALENPAWIAVAETLVRSLR